MKTFTALALLIAVAACATSKTATFSCTRGPEVAVEYGDDTVTLSLAGGRTEVVPRDPSRDGYFAKPGLVWSETEFRTGRLIDGTASYSCDQSSV